MPDSTPVVSIRPVTSKARGICKYYTTKRGCFSGVKCKFLHGVPRPDGETQENERPLLTPYDQAKRCKFFDKGYCTRGDKCWFLHGSHQSTVSKDEEDEEICSICFEKPAIYGLLGGCSHIFCLTCLKQWRDPQNKPEGVTESGNTKKCPMCRVSSKFITPSSKFWRNGTEEKQKVMTDYMASMAKVPCRYFQKSLLKNKCEPICPYGKDCFYSHRKEDGTPYIFNDGVDVCMKKYGKARRENVDSFNFIPIDEFLQSAFSYTVNRSDPMSDDSMPDLEPIASADTPTIHRQHDSDHVIDDDVLTHAQRRRIQDAMMRSLNSPNSGPGLLAMEILRVGWEMTGASLATRSEWDLEDAARRDVQRIEDERENEALERLGLMADEMINAVREVSIANEGRTQIPTVASDNASSSRAIRGFSTAMTGQPEDDSDSDMPALKSVSSDSEEDESDEEDLDAGDSLQDSEATEQSSVPRFGSVHIVDISGQSINSGAQSVDEDSDEVRNPRQDTTIMMQPVTPTNRDSKTNGSSRPSDAFTTDGRGRVISVGDTGTTPAQSAIEFPEVPAGGEPTQSQTSERRGGGIFGWIGSLI